MQCRPVTSHHPWPNPTHGTPDGAQKRATRPSEPQGAAEAWAAGAQPPGTPLQTSSGAAPATPPRAAQAAAGGKVRPPHRHSQLQRRGRHPRRLPRRYLPLSAYPPALHRARRPPRRHSNHPAAADAPLHPATGCWLVQPSFLCSASDIAGRWWQAAPPNTQNGVIRCLSCSNARHR